MLNSLLSKIKPSSNDQKSILALVGGTTIAQVINFLFSPIQTRLFSPEVFGELAVFTSITGIINAIICLGYDQGIVLPNDEDEAIALLKLSWIFTFLVTSISFIILYFDKENIFQLFGAFNLQKYWYFIPLILYTTGIIQSSNYLLIRKRKFTQLSNNKIVFALTINVVSIGLGLIGNIAIGARLISIIIANVINIIMLTWIIYRENVFKNWKVAFNRIEIIKKYKNFLLFDIWSNLINNLSWMLVPILMNTYYGSFSAGQYSIGLRVIQIPANIIGASISQVFLKTASEKRETRDLYNYTREIIKKLLIYSTPVALILMLFSKILFRIIFGDKWETAGIYVQILSPWTLIWFIASPISVVFTVLQKQNILLILTILNLLLRYSSLSLGHYLGSDIYGLLAFSVSGIIVYSLIIIMALKITLNSDKNVK